MREKAELQNKKEESSRFFNGFKSFGRKIKEFLRKKIVYLKRQPSTIPLIFLVICFVIYTFKLTSISNTTAYIYGSNMGILCFACVLCSALAIVSYVGAYPRRSKVRVFMLILSFVLVGIVIFCDIAYNNGIISALTREVDPIIISEKTSYIQTALDMLKVHLIFVCITIFLMATLPLYAKLIRKIDTSVEVDDTAIREKIDIDEK